MFDLRAHGLLVGLIVLISLIRPAAAFGAGNIASISKVEGQNWRHGDIEDALLSLAMAHAIKGGKNFNKMYVSRVYFGNWLRDYSQAIDVGTLKSVSAEAIRLLLCVLGFLTFGYGSGEFEVTAERVGCYRPEDHIDNPKGYADGLDARDYDRRLRGPIDEGVELAVDQETGMKNYIANERAGIMTSAKHVRKLFTRCIELGRQYKEQQHKPDLYEALRLMGTGLHCLEDFFAHSNYTELALIELGERDVFPHVGSNTQIQIEVARGSVYPIVTGTFGGVDFLHSVTGEVSDKLTQNEIDELEGTLKESQRADTSLLRDLLDKIPDGIFGDKNQGQKIDELQNNASAAQMENVAVSPRDPEEFTVYVGNLYQQIMPAIRFHDDIMKSISNAVEKIPVLPKIIEQLEEQLSQFVFSIIAPFIVPLIDQIKNELKTGSEEIIHSSEKEQHIVFNEDECSDPTHSMLSKDHFSNILNEVAGRTAAKMLHWVVPQLMEAIDNESVDVNRLMDRIIHGVMHHPAQREIGRDGVSEARQLIFASVEEWWRDMGDDQRQDYRRKLSRNGVLHGQNHKEGVYDTGHGHGCSGKLKMRKLYGAPETLEDKIAGAAANAILAGATSTISGIVQENTGYKIPTSQKEESNESGLGGFFSAIGSSLFGGGSDENHSRREESYNRNDDGSYTHTETEYGRQGNRYSQTEHSETQYGDGGRRSEHRRYEQESSYGGEQTSSYSYQRTETHTSSYEQRTERHEYGGSGGYGGDDNEGYGSSHRRGGDDEDDEGGYGRRQGGGYGREESGYGSGGGYGRQEESSYGGREESGYGSQNREEESSYGGYERRGENESYGGDYERNEEEDEYGSSRRRRDDYEY